jgi:hypothetical protein
LNQPISSPQIIRMFGLPCVAMLCSMSVCPAESEAGFHFCDDPWVQ